MTPGEFKQRKSDYYHGLPAQRQTAHSYHLRIKLSRHSLTGQYTL